MDNQYVLATYDILGKQDFIYRSTRMKEIVGGSALIRNCYEKWLYPEAKKAGKADDRGIFRKQDEAFSRENFRRHMEEGYIGEVIYEGGGNFLLLFKNAEAFREVTWRFSKAVLENTGSLRVLAPLSGMWILTIFRKTEGGFMRSSRKMRIGYVLRFPGARCRSLRWIPAHHSLLWKKGR